MLAHALWGHMIYIVSSAYDMVVWIPLFCRRFGCLVKLAKFISIHVMSGQWTDLDNDELTATCRWLHSAIVVGA